LTVRPAWFKRNHRTKPRAIALCWGYVLRNFLMYPLAPGWQWWGFQFTIVHSPTGRHPDLVGGFKFLYVVNHRKGSKRDDWLRWRGDDVGTGGSTTNHVCLATRCAGGRESTTVLWEHARDLAECLGSHESMKSDDAKK
jgi:hypothetical protein